VADVAAGNAVISRERHDGRPGPNADQFTVDEPTHLCRVICGRMGLALLASRPAVIDCCRKRENRVQERPRAHKEEELTF